jgi:pimeloyl-ACP methyl ester carboxylesterase
MPTVMFIHGMFLTPKIWSPWRSYFEQRGYDCVAPAWPLHEGEPAELRERPPVGLGTLGLATVIDAMERAAAPYSDLILIGYSMGGLLVQRLVAKGIGRYGVAVCSVAPNRMLAFDWSFLRNSAAITNPLAGDAPCRMDAADFHRNFANTLDAQGAYEAWQAHAVHESRNVLRDCLGEAGHIDLERPHVPLLFVGAEKDEIIPPQLCERNAKAYTDPHSLSDYDQIRDRSHFICGEPGWDEVAATIANWLDEQRRAAEGASLEQWRVEFAREVSSSGQVDGPSPP